jgi:hypothetical protein
VVAIPENCINNFRDLTCFVWGTVNVEYRNGSGKFPGVEALLLNEIAINEGTHGTGI